MAFSEEKQAAIQAQMDTGKFTDDEVYKMVMEGAKKGYSFSVPVKPEAPPPVPAFVQEQPQMAPAAPVPAPPEPTIDDPMIDQQDVPMGAPIATYTGGFAPELASASMLDPAVTAPVVDPVVGDLSVDGPTSVEKYKYVEREEEHGTSASNRREGYSPPMNLAMREIYMLPGRGGEGVSPYIHLEPPAYRIYEDMPNLSAEAIADIQENGEDSEVVQEWRDAVWAQVSETMAKHGEAAYRPQYMKADSLASVYGKLMGMATAPSISMISSIDDAMSLGAARQVMASVEEPSPAEQELVNRGVIPSAADRMKDTQSTHPAASLTGSAISMMFPGPHNISKGMAKLESKAFKAMGGHADDAVTLGGRMAQSGKRAGKAAAATAGGAGLMELGETMVEALGRQARGERHADVGAIGARFARSAIMSGMLGGVTDILGRTGTWAGNALRTSDTDIAKRINSLEAAEGIDTATGVLQGLEASPKHKALKREMVADLGTPASARGPHERLELEHKGPLGKELDRLADRDMAPLREANKAYYADVGAPRMSMVGLYKSLRRTADDKESVPFVREQLRKHLKKFEYKSKAGKALPGGDRIEWGTPVRGEVPGIRRMNAQELDEAIAGIDDLLNMGTAKGGGKSPALMEAQAELRRMYDSWGPTADGRKWSDVKADHHQVRNRVEARAHRFGNAGLATGGERKYSNAMGEAESNNLLNAVRASGNDANRYMKMLNDLKENKPLARWLTEQRAITAKQGQVGEVGAHISAPVVGDRRGAGIASIGLEGLVTRGVDPIFTLMSKLNGRAGNASRMSASSGEVGPMGSLEMQALASDGKLWTYGEAADLRRAARQALGLDKEEE